MNIPVQIASDEAIARAASPGFPDQAQIKLLMSLGLFSPDDEIALRRVWAILKDQTDDYLDMTLGMLAAYPALRREQYADSWLDNPSRLREHFRQWLHETCFSPNEPHWIKQLYSEQSLSDSELTPGFRHIVALAYPLAAMARPFLLACESDHQDIERMQCALLKAILLQVALLSKLYVKDELW